MAADTSWATLPSIIIVEILSYLSFGDKLNVSAVCRRWRSCLFHPSLWRCMSFKLKNGSRRKAKHLADMCGKYVRETVVEFNARNVGHVRELARIMNIFGSSVNLEKLVLRPTSCQIEWPERDFDEETLNFFLDGVDSTIRNARRIKQLSFGCIGELCDHADEYLPLLAQYQATSLQKLHIASVKENPESYGLIDLPVLLFNELVNLTELGIDYDYITNELLLGFIDKRKARLQKLVIHVHGIEPDHEKITNDTWCRLANHSPKLEVTLNLIHSIDGALGFLDILQPGMPLAHLRMFFCSHINTAGITYISQHNYKHLKSIYIIDGMTDLRPNSYQVDTDEDPFVMLAWKCPSLQHFTLIGYEIAQDDVVAIARLRGPRLQTLDIPLCCISTVEEDGENVYVAFGTVDNEFISEVCRSLGTGWQPMAASSLHPAVEDMHADAETAYLSLLLEDQVG